MGNKYWDEEAVMQKIRDIITVLKDDFPLLELEPEQVYNYYQEFGTVQIPVVGRIMATIFYALRKTFQPYTQKELRKIFDIDIRSMNSNYRKFLEMTGRKNVFNSAENFLPRYFKYVGIKKEQQRITADLYRTNMGRIDAMPSSPSIKAKCLIYMVCKMLEPSADRTAISRQLRISFTTLDNTCVLLADCLDFGGK